MLGSMVSPQSPLLDLTLLCMCPGLSPGAPAIFSGSWLVPSGPADLCHVGIWILGRVDVYLPDRDTLAWVGHSQIIHPLCWISPSLLFPSPLAQTFIAFLVHISKVSFLSCILNGACKLMVLSPDVLPHTKEQCLPLSWLSNHQLLVRITSGQTKVVCLLWVPIVIFLR